MIPEIYNGKNFSILFRARSGYGKTFLCEKKATKIELNNFCFYEIKEAPGFYIQKRFHFIDEIHIVKNVEYYYPFMDSGRFTFLFASNLSGRLPEAFKNRCIIFEFEDYKTETIAEILSYFVKLPHEQLYYVAKNCKGNPRIAKMVGIRLNYMIKEKVIKSNAELEEILNQLGIHKGGLTEIDLKYIDFVQKFPKGISLSMIENTLGIDRETITEEIEPFLLQKGILSISSKGRKIP